jgi:hypothetical protein
MPELIHPLLMLIARATEKELVQYVEYLKAENRILRSKLPKHINVTPAERERLVTRGKPAGKKIKELITIVSPRTFAKWASGEAKSVGKTTAKVGRARNPEEVRQLVVQMAKDNGCRPIAGGIDPYGPTPQRPKRLDPSRGRRPWDLTRATLRIATGLPAVTLGE